MINAPSPMQWVPEPVHRHSVRVLSGWVIGLSIVTAIGALVVGVAIVAPVLFSDRYQPVVVSSPRDCRLGGDADAPRLYLTVDIAAMTTLLGLVEATPINSYGRKVEEVAVVPSVPPLSELDDAEFLQIVRDGQENPRWFGDDEIDGVVVAVVDLGDSSGSLHGLRTRWNLGEPAARQDIPLGIEVTPTMCTMTRTG